MKKTILLLAIILLAGQVYAQIPEDLDARVANPMDTNNAGGNAQISLMQPYESVYYYKRIA